MSTRCHVIVKDQVTSPEEEWTYIYHHHDGYPEGVGKYLKDKFSETIGNETGHTQYHKDDIVKMICEIDDEFEVDDGLHSDEEYVYIVEITNDRRSVIVTYYHCLPFSYNCRSASFNMDDGFEYVQQDIINQKIPVVLDEKEEKEVMEAFKHQITTLHNVDLLEMMKLICIELTLRETE